MSTPSPYLRDRLLQAADGLRKDAETARLNLAEAEQDVAEALEILAEAKAQRDRAQAEVDGIEAGIAWAEAHAATITREIDADPAAKLRATGLMRHEPKEIPAEEHTCATMGCTSCAGCDGCTCHDPAHTCLPWDASTQTECPACREIAGNGKPVNGDNLPPAARTPAEVNAALTPPVPHEPAGPDATHCPTCESPEPSLHPAVSGGGEVTHICDDPFHGPVPQDPAGQPVATHGPTVTMPDTGLNPPPLPPADPTGEPRHAKPARPGLLARLTGGHPIITAQDGDL